MSVPTAAAPASARLSLTSLLSVGAIASSNSRIHRSRTVLVRRLHYRVRLLEHKAEPGTGAGGRASE